MTPIVIEIMPRRVWPVGTTTSAPRSIPLGYSFFRLEVDRTEWLDPSIKVACRFDLSLDAGQTWKEGYVAFTAEGGPLQPASPIPGVNPNLTIVSSDLGDPTNQDRQVKAQLTISGQAVTIDAVLTIT